MKHVLIVHGCAEKKEARLSVEERSYPQPWMRWMEQALRGKGYRVDIPLMPTPWAPVYEDYKKMFEQYPLSEETILVGHSCGCAFLVRYLSEVPVHVRALICVAPWKIDEHGSQEGRIFYDFPIDPGIAERVESIVYFTSENEYPQGKKGLKWFHGILGGKVIHLSGRGHYTREHSLQSEQFPEILELISSESD